MKKITFRAEEDLIDRARQAARAENKTLNAAFREWLERYVRNGQDAKERRRLVARLRDRVVAGRKFTREEMNEG